MNEQWSTNRGDRVTVFPRRGILRTRWYWHVQSAGNWEVIEQGQGHPDRRDAVSAALRHHPRVEVAS